jgi:hypothetical protein
VQRRWLQPKDVVVVVNARGGARSHTNTLRVMALSDLGAA